jgi:hypothetical protein
VSNISEHNVNLNLWDQLRRVPKEHLKGFKRGGGFTGTAIKPMWTFHRVTEVLGPVGKGWNIGEPVFETVAGKDGEIMVFCTVNVLTPEGGCFFGVGGDKVVKYIKADERYNRPERWENDDEAFKKAYTDALTNALKLLGAGADVHMGLWDGNKYVDEKPEPANEQHDRAPHINPPPKLSVHAEREHSVPDTADIGGTKGAPKNKAAKELYDKLVWEMKKTQTIEGLKTWLKLFRPEIETLPDEWMAHFDEAYEDHRDSIKARAA